MSKIRILLSPSRHLNQLCIRQLFHGKLHCQSPKELVSFIVKHVKLNTSYPDEKPLRILDMGAGNGVVASEIKEQLGAQIGELVGTDILPEAREAAMRDRPGIYDQYIVADLLDEKQQQWLGKSQFDVVVTCAALGPGWGDMPVQILLGILKLVHVGGLIGITLNERWLEKEDLSPWGHFIAMLNGRSNEDWKQLRELGRKRYKHRLDVRGKWIWYICLVFEKVEILVTT